MSKPDEIKKYSRKITWKSLWSTMALALSVTIFVFVTLNVSRLLEARSSGKKTQEIKVKAEEKSTWSGSLISPLHRIPLMDGFNQKIIPAAPDSPPFSTRNTCAPCHDYDRISGGTHFNFRTRPETDRITEPWVLVEEKAGVQLPISFQNYPGLWSPEKLGMSTWQFVNLFGPNLNGGGLGEPAEKEITPDSRWNVSGKLEINCLGCHNKSYLQDHSEWVKQVMRQNFRWAATAASGLGEMTGMASRLPGTWSIIDGPNRMTMSGRLFLRLSTTRIFLTAKIMRCWTYPINLKIVAVLPVIQLRHGRHKLKPQSSLMFTLLLVLSVLIATAMTSAMK